MSLFHKNCKMKHNFLSISDLLEKLELLKARNRDLLTIDEIRCLDQAIERLKSLEGQNKMKLSDFEIPIRLLLELLTKPEIWNNM